MSADLGNNYFLNLFCPLFHHLYPLFLSSSRHSLSLDTFTSHRPPSSFFIFSSYPSYSSSSSLQLFYSTYVYICISPFFLLLRPRSHLLLLPYSQYLVFLFFPFGTLDQFKTLSPPLSLLFLMHLHISSFYTIT